MKTEANRIAADRTVVAVKTVTRIVQAAGIAISKNVPKRAENHRMITAMLRRVMQIAVIKTVIKIAINKTVQAEGTVAAEEMHRHRLIRCF